MASYVCLMLSEREEKRERDFGADLLREIPVKVDVCVAAVVPAVSIARMFGCTIYFQRAINLSNDGTDMCMTKASPFPSFVFAGLFFLRKRKEKLIRAI